MQYSAAFFACILFLSIIIPRIVCRLIPPLPKERYHCESALSPRPKKAEGRKGPMYHAGTVNFSPFFVGPNVTVQKIVATLFLRKRKNQHLAHFRPSKKPT